MCLSKSNRKVGKVIRAVVKIAPCSRGIYLDSTWFCTRFPLHQQKFTLLNVVLEALPWDLKDMRTWFLILWRMTVPWPEWQYPWMKWSFLRYSQKLNTLWVYLPQILYFQLGLDETLLNRNLESWLFVCSWSELHVPKFPMYLTPIQEFLLLEVWNP